MYNKENIEGKKEQRKSINWFRRHLIFSNAILAPKPFVKTSFKLSLKLLVDVQMLLLQQRWFTDYVLYKMKSNLQCRVYFKSCQVAVSPRLINCCCSNTCAQKLTQIHHYIRRKPFVKFRGTAKWKQFGAILKK